MRVDRTENTQRSVDKGVAFSTGMLRKYGLLYLVLFYYPSLGKKAWVSDLLRFYGWDGNPDTRNKFYNMLYMSIKMLNHDFDVVIEIIRTDKSKRNPDQKGYYTYLKMRSYGVFERTRLRKLLSDNGELFENIFENSSL